MSTQTVSFAAINGVIKAIKDKRILPGRFLEKPVHQAIYYLQAKGWKLQEGSFSEDAFTPDRLGQTRTITLEKE